MKSLTSVCFLSVSLILAACAGAPNDGAAESTAADLIAGRAGAVYVLSNDAVENEVIVYRRANDGTLQHAASYGTTGKGSGDALASQGALTMSSDRSYLFAVNAGSNELSVFRVNGEHLSIVDTIATGGVRPVSVTEHCGVVYVLHGGDGANDVRGFAQRANGTLVAISNSTHALSAPTTGPAEVSFNADGTALVVTEKATNLIDELRLSASGRPVSFVAHPSQGMTPYGFAIDARGQVIVSEAHGGTAGASTVSSYQLGSSHGLTTVSAEVPSNEGAACWVALGGDHAFVSNTASGSISTYVVGSAGSLALAKSEATLTGDGSKPADLAMTKNGNFLYMIDSGTHALGIAHVGLDGALTMLAPVAGLPASAAGLAAE